MDETRHVLEGLLNQFPVVGLVLWMFHKFRQYENESRARWFAYMRERDEALRETLNGGANAQLAVAGEIKALAMCVTRLDARLKG